MKRRRFLKTFLIVLIGEIIGNAAIAAEAM
jgi:hypothetical protein